MPLLGACAATPPAPRPPDSRPTHATTQHHIVTPIVDGTPAELLARAERALLAQRWQQAVDALLALLLAEPDGPHVEQALLDLGIALEGLGDREKARVRYRELVKRFPDGPSAKQALVREATVNAYLEDWPALGETGAALLARKDLDDVDRMLALGARGLSKIEAGEDVAASKDVHDGLDLVDQLHYGAENRLPVAAAQLRFAQGEIRRVRSERIGFVPVTPDFLVKIELRCQMLLEAQGSFADAIRSVDPVWAKMSGYRVGEMYRVLHKDLMAIPPTEQAKTEHDRQLFYAIMHVRYRALLDKGVEMMRRTLALAEKTDDKAWVRRAEAAKKEMEDALVEERAQLARFPFTEAEVERALAIMKEGIDKKKRDAERKAAKP